MTTTKHHMELELEAKREDFQKWEFFCDMAYFDQWAVRPIEDNSFSSQNLFHVPTKAEAMALCDLLNNNFVVPSE